MAQHSSPDAHSNKLAYEAITQGIRVRVVPLYLADQSEPENNQWVWAYRVEIKNLSDQPVQLRERHWDITDARGTVQTVDGAGVVGEQPVLRPGHKFDYTSGCPLTTPSGFMSGYYTMVNLPLPEDGSAESLAKAATRMKPFQVTIPAFALDVPHAGQKATLN